MGCKKLYIETVPNIRLAYPKKVEKPLKNKGDYYPFGLKHGNYNATKKKITLKASNNEKQLVPTYRYKYNGKELQDELGLDWYDLGARNYDQASGVFISIDPRAEEYDYQSPYDFSAGNPVFYIDINGEGVETKYINEGGEVIADIDDGSDAVYFVTEGNEADLITDLINENVTNDNQDADINADIGDKYGRTLGEYQKEDMLNQESTIGGAFDIGYENGYDPESGAPFLIQFQSGTGSAYGKGKGVGKRDKRNGVMSKLNPKIKDGEPKHDFCSMINSARTAKTARISSTYTIQKGDDLTKIAKSNNTTVGSLVKLNNIKTPNHIEIGNIIKLN